MAYVDQSSDFGYGTELTSTQMQNLRDNLAAFAAQDSGAPDISAVIDQAALKTDTEEETADVAPLANGNWEQFTFANVGEYGFYPRIKFEASTHQGKVQTFQDSAAGSTSYTTTISVTHESGTNKNCYVQIRYVTASGEIYWLFILQDKKTKKYIRMHGCPDHPAISRNDVEAVQHPFYNNYDPAQHNIFCVPLTKLERKEVEDLREWKNEMPQLTFLETVKKYYDIDENPSGAKWPTIPVTIGVDRNRRPIKKKIPKRNYIKQAKLVKKQ